MKKRFSLIIPLILLPFFASAEIFTPLPGPGQEAMSTAIENGDLEAVKHFVEEDNATYYLTVADDYGYTGLHDAVDYNQFAIAEYFIKKGANVNAKAGNDVTPLFVATHRNHPKLVKLLVEGGADVDAQTAKGISSLVFASEFGYTETVEILLKAKANPNSQSHHNGVTPLIVASLNGRADIVKILLDAGANPRAKAITDVDSVGFAKQYLQSAENPNQWQKTIDLLEEKAKTAPEPRPMPRASRGDDPASQFLDQTDDHLDKLNYALILYIAKIGKRDDLTSEQQTEMISQFIEDVGTDKIDVDEFIKENGDR